MKYLLSIMLIFVALILGCLGILFKQFDLDVAGVLIALLAAGIFLWSSLHLSLNLRSPRQRAYRAPAPRSDQEQAELLGEVIFRSKDEPME